MDFIINHGLESFVRSIYKWLSSSVVDFGRCFSVSGSLGSMTETPGMPASAAQSFGWVTEALWAWDSYQKACS